VTNKGVCSIDGMMKGETEVLGEKPVSMPLGPPQILHGLWCLSVLIAGNKNKIRSKAASNGTTFIPSILNIDHLDKQTQAKLPFSPLK
jgi:hypothetical protein